MAVSVLLLPWTRLFGTGLPVQHCVLWFKPSQMPHACRCSLQPGHFIDHGTTPLYACSCLLQVGSIFEYLDGNAIFGVVAPDSPLWAPILGFFAFTGIPMAGGPCCRHTGTQAQLQALKLQGVWLIDIRMDMRMVKGALCLVTQAAGWSCHTSRGGGYIAGLYPRAVMIKLMFNIACFARPYRR